jgi:hypothetical protein
MRAPAETDEAIQSQRTLSEFMFLCLHVHIDNLELCASGLLERGTLVFLGRVHE